MEILVQVKRKMIDLTIEQYRRGKSLPAPLRDWDGNPIFKKRAVVETTKNDRAFIELIRKLRHGAHKTHENHNKQLQFLLDRERYAQNKTWQGEYDRLASNQVPAELQPFVNARLNELSALLIK